MKISKSPNKSCESIHRYICHTKSVNAFWNTKAIGIPMPHHLQSSLSMAKAVLLQIIYCRDQTGYTTVLSTGLFFTRVEALCLVYYPKTMQNGQAQKVVGR
ncbi:hypothetical protein CDAR_243851 [Caerostris darwini]|uniref:Uncharacterized protein n=1 Tax=Caerostris darwini TaxID=1538125 RepID=A0AAV4W574_9ARAC|nr:hypothetical protein CDAR_243851 [Caerostris darwini]